MGIQRNRMHFSLAVEEQMVQLNVEFFQRFVKKSANIFHFKIALFTLKLTNKKLLEPPYLKCFNIIDPTPPIMY